MKRTRLNRGVLEGERKGDLAHRTKNARSLGKKEKKRVENQSGDGYGLEGETRMDSFLLFAGKKTTGDGRFRLNYIFSKERTSRLLLAGSQHEGAIQSYRCRV